MQLDQWPLNKAGRIVAIDWARLDPAESHRLRDLGFAEGVDVQPLHRGWLFFRDPLAVRVGRMTVAIRSALAATIEVEGT